MKYYTTNLYHTTPHTPLTFLPKRVMQQYDMQSSGRLMRGDGREELGGGADCWGKLH